MSNDRLIRVLNRWRELANAFHEDATKAEDERDALVEALKLARARIEYLGAACTDHRHFQNNLDVVLPKIDAALNGDVGGPTK